MGLRRRAYLVLALAFSIACGGGGTAPPPPPPPPPPAPSPTVLSIQAGNNQNGTAGGAVTVNPSVKVVDANSNPLANITVTFAVTSGGGSVTGATPATDVNGIATVGSWTLGAAGGTNTLTATVSGSGITGNPATFTATAAVAFQPSTNTTLSGTQSFGSVNIPAGVTVTMTADVVLNVAGPVTIAGTLVGNCVNVSITATGVLTSSGNINNGCSSGIPAGGRPSMTLVARGGYHLTGGIITLGGPLNLTNDPTLTDASFPVPPGPAIRTSGSGRAAHAPVGVCAVSNGAQFIANPSHATDGLPGQVGGKAEDGSTWVLQCTGELDLASDILVLGQEGGRGGSGSDTRGSGAVATGGDGGEGGIIKVRANNGDLVFVQGSEGTTIASGSGGDGGGATATATQAGSPGGDATATGGRGGAPGNILLEAKNGDILIDGEIFVNSGLGGDGGDAMATGADGLTTALCPSGRGGAASATGGAGGTTPDIQLITTGTVTGFNGIFVVGGNAGNGGPAEAVGGKGAPGGAPNAFCPDGGNGGPMTAVGGQGGNSLVKDVRGALVGNGGNGGFIEFAGGNGGDGFNACTRPNLGVGGRGGSANGTGGSAGAFGTGLADGTAGSGALNGTLKGGNSGNGLPPGHHGLAGFNGATSTLPFEVIAPSLIPGQDGVACTFSFTATFTPVGDIHNYDGQYWHLSGVRTVTIQPGPVVTGQLGADGTFAEAIGAVAPLVLKGEFFLNPQGQWDSRTPGQTLSGGLADLDFGGLFTFPNTLSGIHFVGTLILAGTQAGAGHFAAPITYNVIMDAQ